MGRIPLLAACDAAARPGPRHGTRAGHARLREGHARRGPRSADGLRLRAGRPAVRRREGGPRARGLGRRDPAARPARRHRRPRRGDRRPRPARHRGRLGVSDPPVPLPALQPRARARGPERRQALGPHAHDRQPRQRRRARGDHPGRGRRRRALRRRGGLHPGRGARPRGRHGPLGARRHALRRQRRRAVAGHGDRQARGGRDVLAGQLPRQDPARHARRRAGARPPLLPRRGRRQHLREGPRDGVPQPLPLHAAARRRRVRRGRRAHAVGGDQHGDGRPELRVAVLRGPRPDGRLQRHPGLPGRVRVAHLHAAEPRLHQQRLPRRRRRLRRRRAALRERRVPGRVRRPHPLRRHDPRMAEVGEARRDRAPGRAADAAADGLPQLPGRRADRPAVRGGRSRGRRARGRAHLAHPLRADGPDAAGGGPGDAAVRRDGRRDRLLERGQRRPARRRGHVPVGLRRRDDLHGRRPAAARVRARGLQPSS